MAPSSISGAMASAVSVSVSGTATDTWGACSGMAHRVPGRPQTVSFRVRGAEP